MKNTSRISIHWFRRDLRLEDNHALFQALNSGESVIPLFIFDEDILQELPKNDARVSFIHDQLHAIQERLQKLGSSLLVIHGHPVEVWKKLSAEYEISSVHCNADYEPYAMKRDEEIKALLAKKNIPFFAYKDQVIFEKNDVLKADGTPYTVYTPYSKKWLAQCSPSDFKAFPSEEHLDKFHTFEKTPDFPSLKVLGFERSSIIVPDFRLEKSRIQRYAETRNLPAADGTSLLSTHLRFGTISVRSAFRRSMEWNETFAKELIWREFLMQILFHFPQVVHQSFRVKYDHIIWRNNEKEFALWCEGKTGFPMVDAGMRELNATGLMHNRVRMVVASFLCKHLLIDWRWGEAYFANKLLDFELSSNNGNWQWAAGSGCDAAPYFRVFNPSLQMERFDKNLRYIKKWVPEYETSSYPEPIVEHALARDRAIATYKKALDNFKG
jgi:deoxyribodipyrimidine photo-lyase